MVQGRPRRGRPSGKNRVPLNLEQRRARNAQYEKERREEISKAMTQLAEAVGCDPMMVDSDLMATVISFIQNKSTEEDVDSLRSCNERLMAQIDDCERRLASDEPPQIFHQPVQNTNYHDFKRKRNDSDSSERQSAKKSKISSDPGVDTCARVRTYTRNAALSSASRLTNYSPQIDSQMHQTPDNCYVPSEVDPAVSPSCGGYQTHQTPNHSYAANEVDDAVLQSFMSTFGGDIDSLDPIGLEQANNWSIDQWIDEYL